MGVTTEIVAVDPALATEWLTHNDINRRLKPNKIKEYARDMAHGRWRMTGEPIKFSDTGHLLDGQNRAHAVIASGATVDMMVVRGLEANAQDVMDAGAKRTAGDQLFIKGHRNSTALAASAKVLICWDLGLFVNSASNIKYVPTHAEALEYIEANPDIVPAVDLAMAAYKVLQMPPSCMGASSVLFGRSDERSRDHFFQSIIQLQIDGQGDPIGALMKRAMQDRSARRRARPAETMYVLIRTWNAWRRNEPLNVLRINNWGTPMSMPKPR